MSHASINVCSATNCYPRASRWSCGRARWSTTIGRRHTQAPQMWYSEPREYRNRGFPRRSTSSNYWFADRFNAGNETRPSNTPGFPFSSRVPFPVSYSLFILLSRRASVGINRWKLLSAPLDLSQLLRQNFDVMQISSGISACHQILLPTDLRQWAAL